MQLGGVTVPTAAPPIAGAGVAPRQTPLLARHAVTQIWARRCCGERPDFVGAAL